MQVDEVAAVVGCDVQAIDEVAAAVTRFGGRYLDRVYTRSEQRDSVQPGSLAARFAAKEAVLKLIGRADGIDLRSVEVLRGPGGRPQVRLHGEAALAGAQAGVGPIDVSLSHTAGLAFAVATAVRRGDRPASPSAPPASPPAAHPAPRTGPDDRLTT